MTKQQKYRIVADINGVFCVQKRTADGSWMEAHRCLSKNENGYKEARLWLDSQDKKGGGQ